MINSSENYKAAIIADTRQMVLKAVIDIIDPDIVYGTPISSTTIKYSDYTQIFDKDFSNAKRFATLEENRWLLDGSFYIYSDEKQEGERYNVTLNELSNEDGSFTNEQFAELQFNNVAILQACSVYFSSDSLDGYPINFKVEIKQGGSVYYSKEFIDNKETNVFLDGFTVNNPDAIRVTVTKWSRSSRRVRFVEIVPGVYENWTGDEIASFSLKQQIDPACAKIPYGTCSMTIDNLDRRFEPRNKSGVFQSIEERQGIPVYVGALLPDGSIEYKQQGIFYQYSEGWKTGDNGLTISWELVDIIGLLANREFIVPTVLPTTLEEWAAAIVSQLGNNFANNYEIEEDLKNISLTTTKENIQGKTCGEIIRLICQASGSYPRASSETGFLTIEKLKNEGDKITLDNLNSYPVVKANSDLAAIIFELNNERFVVGGNSTSSSSTLSINNPFITSEEQALVVAKNILANYGGNQYELTGRGNPASEVGDMDVVWLNEETAATGRRTQQNLSFSNGVLQGCKSVLIQANAALNFENRKIFTNTGTFTVPEGVSKLRLILVGKGNKGETGTDGTWSTPGQQGNAGSGGLVWSGTITVAGGQVFNVSCAENSTFGVYSSANGLTYEYGFVDIDSGEVYARSGVDKPLAGSGDGGIGGAGGLKGNLQSNGFVDNYPTTGSEGVDGATGCVIVYWEG